MTARQADQGRFDLHGSSQVGSLFGMRYVAGSLAG